MGDIPLSIGAIDADWLGRALRDEGHDHPGIASISTTPMPGIVGALGEVGVVEVDYSGPCTLPRSFVAKCLLDSDLARLYNQIMMPFIRESGFYRDLAGDVEMRIPECYVNVSEGTDKFMMLIEHVTPAVAGDILVGTSVDNMRKLATDLGTMHGQFWMRPQLTTLPWVVDWSAPSYPMGIPLVQDSWAKFNEREPDTIPADLQDVCSRTFVNDTLNWLARFNERAWTFIHGDYELDNMMFTDLDGTGDIVVLDWQMSGKSFAGQDLAFFLTASGTDESIAAERELLDAYRAALAAAGGPAWSHDELIEDMAWSMIFWIVGHTVSTTADQSSFGDKAERMERRFRKFLTGALAGAERWDVAARLAKHL
jgi:hypothetical protein